MIKGDARSCFMLAAEIAIPSFPASPYLRGQGDVVSTLKTPKPYTI